MKEILAFEYIDEFSSNYSNIYPVNVYKLIETENNEQEKDENFNNNIQFLNKIDETYFKLSKFSFKLVLIGLGEYNEISNKLIIKKT